jgi:hypothetical protein
MDEKKSSRSSEVISPLCHSKERTSLPRTESWSVGMVGC